MGRRDHCTDLLQRTHKAEGPLYRPAVGPGDPCRHTEKHLKQQIAAAVSYTHLIRKNDELIRLGGTRPLPFSLEELACKPGQETTSEVLQAIGLR